MSKIHAFNLKKDSVDKVSAMAAATVKEYAAMTDRELNAALEHVTGGIPNVEDLREHGSIESDPKGTIFLWKGKAILIISPVKIIDGKISIGVDRLYLKARH